MIANFKELKVRLSFEGEPQIFDLRKDLGNTIRRNTVDIGLDETARKIYFSEGDVDIPDEHVADIISIVNKNYIVPVQEAITELLTHKKE